MNKVLLGTLACLFGYASAEYCQDLKTWKVKLNKNKNLNDNYGNSNATVKLERGQSCQVIVESPKLYVDFDDYDAKLKVTSYEYNMYGYCAQNFNIEDDVEPQDDFSDGCMYKVEISATQNNAEIQLSYNNNTVKSAPITFYTSDENPILFGRFSWDQYQSGYKLAYLDVNSTDFVVPIDPVSTYYPYYTIDGAQAKIAAFEEDLYNGFDPYYNQYGYYNYYDQSSNYKDAKQYENQTSPFQQKHNNMLGHYRKGEFCFDGYLNNSYNYNSIYSPYAADYTYEYSEGYYNTTSSEVINSTSYNDSADYYDDIDQYNSSSSDYVDLPNETYPDVGYGVASSLSYMPPYDPYYPYYYQTTTKICVDLDYFFTKNIVYGNVNLEAPQYAIIGLGLDKNYDNLFLKNLTEQSNGMLEKQWSYVASPYSKNLTNLTIGGVDASFNDVELKYYDVYQAADYQWALNVVKFDYGEPDGQLGNNSYVNFDLYNDSIALPFELYGQVVQQMKNEYPNLICEADYCYVEQYCFEVADGFKDISISFDYDSAYHLTPEVYLEDSDFYRQCKINIKSQPYVQDQFITLGRTFFKAFLAVFDLTQEYQPKIGLGLPKNSFAKIE